MRCSKVEKLLSDLHNGELSPTAERAVLDHIAACPSCRETSEAYGEMMEMLAATEPPELPPDFEGTLHMRLATEHARATDAVAGAGWAWARMLRGGALVLVGAAAVTAFFLLRSGPAAESPGVCPDTGALAATDTDTGPAEAALAAADLRVGEVAIVTLTVDGAAESRDAELEVVLPDGLALVGEGHQLLEEKVVTWTTTLGEDERQIRIPVQAQRTGTWRLVARARVGDQDVTTEANLRVSRA